MPLISFMPQKCAQCEIIVEKCIPLTKITVAQNKVALSYHRVRGLYFLAVIFASTIVLRVFSINRDRLLSYF